MTENPSWREVVRGGQEQPAAAPRAGETPEQFNSAQQTHLLHRIAADLATIRKIAVFFTVLWGIGALLFVISFLGSM